ncbi:putative ATP-grasp-modified RiPP [Kitasatospora purpeofusca]|uniref:putative ATP-grasp-modified RiPP n=1 Tax=Kitasatospora purpeofusca TaxID=67352 RepID=UPI002A5A8132|nr:putative ATP-grasp-modified RiPP [Kitasatospora purpeofusca]MDY0816698.1 putative ATP-grasp-modified RiPP [Kitasatospora purpeofusca]
MRKTPAAPWGTTRMRPFEPGAPIPMATPMIDPDSQIAVIVGEGGQVVELGTHGTSTNGLTPTSTGLGDGASPGGATDVDSTESYDQDQSSD